MGFRTDLVDELIELKPLNEYGNAKINKVILNKEEALKINKKEGIYFSITTDAIIHIDSTHEKNLKDALKDVLISLLNYYHIFKDDLILVVGLGNILVTPDSLGPRVIQDLQVTSFLERDKDIQNVSAISPGVMDQTGIETARIVKSIVSEIKPRLVIAIDALAAKSYERLNRSIQVSTSGILVGAGVNNHRLELSKETLGVDMISIGVPTVVDLESLFDEIIISDEFLKKNPNLDYFITSKDIDQNICDLAKVISFTLNDLFLN